MIRTAIKNILHNAGYTVVKSSVSIIADNQKNSFSQCGEDLIIDYIFKLRNIPMPTYMDIGANDPFHLNNTAIFYRRGCHGINLEGNPNLAENFNLYRPADLNLTMGISDIEEERNLYIMCDHTLSTFSRDEYDNLIRNGQKLNEIKKIKLNTIKYILDQYCEGLFPDLLSLDAEGMDLQILKSINFSESAPKIICVEAAAYSPVGAGARRNDLIDFLVSKGYYEYANTNLNAIMVKNDFWFI